LDLLSSRNSWKTTQKNQGHGEEKFQKVKATTGRLAHFPTWVNGVIPSVFQNGEIVSIKEFMTSLKRIEHSMQLKNLDMKHKDKLIKPEFKQRKIVENIFHGMSLS
jgi:hypothetical protein